MHIGWNYGFTEGCILVMNYNDTQKVIDNPQNYLNTDSDGVKNVNWDNSAPTTMSLYEYVEKYVPDGKNKGKIIITEDGEVVDIPIDNNNVNDKKETSKEKNFLETALDIISEIIEFILF
jgi:hypothetical protein